MRYRLLCLLTAAVIGAGINACGGEGKSSDPLGTDSLTFGDSSGSAVLQLDSNGAAQLTAKVKDAAGKAVAEREVIFAFVSNASGATLTATAVNTNAAGEATILYRAGVVSGSDVVRAFISNGARMDVSITVKGSAGGTQISLSAAPTSLSAGQASILTATVTDSTGVPVNGQTVTFAFSANHSGATLVALSGTTDVSGRAIAVYTAGAINPKMLIQDTVQATVANSPSVGAVVITRTAAAGGGGVTLSLVSSVSSLAAGQSAVITATVTDGAGSPVSGQMVTFAFSTNNSGAALTTLSGTTDVSGKAVVQYTAGGNNPTLNVQDAVLASVPDSAAAVVITRTAGGGLNLSLASSVTSLTAGQSAILTATVTDGTGSPVSGQAVTFTFSTNNSGAALTTLSGTTDVNGKAVAQYTAGATSPTINVQDTVQASVTGSIAAIVITRTAGGGLNLSLASSVTSLAAGQSAILTATVTDGTSAPVSGQMVIFAFSTNNSGAALTILSATTDVSGRAVAQYTAGANNPTASVQDTVRASVTGSTAALTITRTVGGAVGFQIGVTATPASLVAGATSIIVAQVSNADGKAAAGQTVSFAFIGGTAPSGATLFPLNSGRTDVGGKALAIYTAGSASPGQSIQDTISVTVPGAVAATIITRLPTSTAGNRISSLTAAPSVLPAATGGTSIVTVTVVGGDNVTPIPGETVTFSVLTGVGTVTPTAVTGNNGKTNAVFTGLGSATGTQSVVRATITGGDAVVIINWQ